MGDLKHLAGQLLGQPLQQLLLSTSLAFADLVVFEVPLDLPVKPVGHVSALFVAL